MVLWGMTNMLIKVVGPANVRSVLSMAISSHVINKKLNAALRRRMERNLRASVDVNADFEGRGSMGDPRLDLARVDRYLRV